MRRRAWVVSIGVLVFVGAPASAQVETTISGVVTAEGGGPLAGICVYASGIDWGSDETDAEGSYSVSVLPGAYTVEFWDCSDHPTFIAEWYDDKPTMQEADPVVVGSGPVTGIDAQLAAGGSIAGAVTNEQDEGIGGICVDAYSDAPPWGFGWTETDPSGSYSVGGLPTGEYVVSFYDCNDEQQYSGEYFDDKLDWFDADLVGVDVGEQTSGIDAVLASVSSPTAMDAAVTDLRVENVPLRGDDGEVGYTGLMREITVEGANLSTSKGGEAILDVMACPVTIGVCRFVHSSYMVLGPGDVFEETIAWNGAGMVGDVTISAELWTFEHDAELDNNYREVDHYVLVGGSGAGVGV